MHFTAQREKVKILLQSFSKNGKLFIFSICFVFIIVFLAIFALFIAPYNPYEINTDAVFLSPSFLHPCGTDRLGRDIFSRIIYGSRVSIEVSLIAVGISIAIGCIIGAVAGFYGKIVDSLLMRFTDIMLTFPTFFLVLAVVTFLGPNIVNVMIVIGLTGWMGVARLVRAEVLKLKNMEFVKAAKLFGASDIYIIIKHLLPNALGPVVVSATLGVGSAILTESALSFLGLGVQPPTPSWGEMLSEGKDYLQVAWWLSFFPGMAIFLTVLSFTIIGERFHK
jgi:peptide/nickel transport system permease protein